MKTAIGLMSGTSMDGIDVALLRTDGEQLVEFGPSMAIEYPAAVRHRIELAVSDAGAIKARQQRPGTTLSVEQDITELHVNAVEQFLRQNRLKPDDVDLLGFHGQTVLHRPEAGLTVQLGDGTRLANATGIDVIYDMRAKDMENGGQGAPLVPVFHHALAQNFAIDQPICFVNIGGISNITYVAGDDLIAFDTGPGNALIDQWVQAKGGIPFDQGGRIASEGSIVQPILDRYLEEEFFKKSGPKSLDRSDFEPLDQSAAELSDGARTLARLTAEAIIASTDHLPKFPATWILCGGGRLNETIVDDLGQLARTKNGKVVLSDDMGFAGDMLEAQAFAYLAVRSFRGLPLTYPLTTGCVRAVTGGKFAAAVAAAVAGQ